MHAEHIPSLRSALALTIAGRAFSVEFRVSFYRWKGSLSSPSDTVRAVHSLPHDKRIAQATVTCSSRLPFLFRVAVPQRRQAANFRSDGAKLSHEVRLKPGPCRLHAMISDAGQLT